MSWQEFVLTILLILLISALAYHRISTRESRLRKRWQLIAEGECVKIISPKVNLNIYLGIAGQRSSPLPVTVSTIFFKNNQSVKVMGLDNLPPVGTRIRVYKNPLPEFKIEIIESPHCL